MIDFGNTKIMWSKNHKYIMNIRGSLDGNYYIEVFEVGKPMQELKIFGSLSYSYTWAFKQAIQQLKNKQ